MLYDAHRQLAQPGQRSTCPTCGQELIAKCGQIVTWHWAHLHDDCDPWTEPESQWHIDWKQRLEARGAQIEVTMGEHRADVVLPDGRIIELQNGYQAIDKIKAREVFYGYNMGWLYRCHWHDRLHWGNKGGFWWKQGAMSMTWHERNLYWDMGEEIAKVHLVRMPQENQRLRVLGRFLAIAPQSEVVERWTRVPRVTVEQESLFQ